MTLCRIFFGQNLEISSNVLPFRVCKLQDIAGEKKIAFVPVSSLSELLNCIAFSVE
jgi:hypothetical protein